MSSRVGQSAVERIRLEKELCSQGVTCRKQLEAILKPDMGWALRLVCGEGRFRMHLMQDIAHRSLACCPCATAFQHVINHLDAINALLDSPRTQQRMSLPVGPFNPDGRRATSEWLSEDFNDRGEGIVRATSAPPALKRHAMESSYRPAEPHPVDPPLNASVRASNFDPPFNASVQPSISGSSNPPDPSPPSAWIHRPPSRSQNRRRVSCMDADNSLPVQFSRWKCSLQVLNDLRHMEDQSKPVRLSAWDCRGQVYKNLEAAISDVEGYCRNPDDEEPKLQWAWADHPPVLHHFRRCVPWRWSTWKNPGNTVAEMHAHTTASRDRPLRLVARSEKVCGSVREAISFLESIHLKYHGEHRQE